MDRKANPRLYDEIQDTESLSVVSTFSYNRAIFRLLSSRTFKIRIIYQWLLVSQTMALCGRLSLLVARFLFFFSFLGGGE